MNKNRCNEKIDFVMIWVDGNDPKWQKEKSKYSNDKNSDNRNIRFRDWENLKYWFRGIEKYTPWVNKIFFVTCGHLPAWLDTSNPKIQVVRHDEFIPKEYLPTFSSHTIELNLHRIKGLSDNFVYFNDDIFIMKKMKKEDFFKNGKPKEMSIISPLYGDDEIFTSVCNTVNIIINKHFNKKKIVRKNPFQFVNFRYGKLNIRSLLCLPFKHFLGFYETHSCNAYRKETFNEVWEQEFDILNQTCLHKFRTKNDVNQYLMKQWQFCSCTTVPTYNKKKLLVIFKDDINYICSYLKKPKKAIICLNDRNSTEEEFENAKLKINNTFEQILPDKSSFEK